MDRNDVISTLNDLIETSKDGEQGFRTCADAVTSPQLKQLLETAAERCTQGALELQNKVRSLGGDPERLGVGRALSRLGQHQIRRHRQERGGGR